MDKRADQNPLELVYINSIRDLNQDEVDRYSYSGLSVCVGGIDWINIMQGRCALSGLKGYHWFKNHEPKLRKIIKEMQKNELLMCRLYRSVIIIIDRYICNYLMVITTN